MKVKMSDVNKMIKEEFEKMMEKKKLSSRLAKINESLNEMDSEDKSLEEVEAGEKTTVSSNSWTGEKNGDVKWEPKFEKNGSSLKEDGLEGMEPENGMDLDVAVEEKPEMGEFEAKFAEIGRAIDAKMKTEMDIAPISDEPASEETTSDDDFEEVEVDGVSDAEVTDGEEGAEDKEVEEVDETVKESVDEPLEGHSVAQEAAADSVNDNMEKDNHVKESDKKEGNLVVEAKTAKGNIFTEGLDDTKKSTLLEEMKRMKKFAGLSRDEE